MIVERAFAEHLVVLNPVLHVFKDELAWTQAGEPWPYLMVTKTAERLQGKGTGRYDVKEWDEGAQEWVYHKAWARRLTLRLTLRSAAMSGKSGTTVLDKVSETVQAFLRRHANGQPLDLVDEVTGTPVHLERLRFLGESDQGPLLTRVPFEAQRTLDVEVWAVVVDEVQRAPLIETNSQSIELN
ncbi:MAG: hypothetical protein Q8O14_12810 [bacterium]|nr:hypothetical protein [bacterium]